MVNEFVKFRCVNSRRETWTQLMINKYIYIFHLNILSSIGKMLMYLAHTHMRCVVKCVEHYNYESCRQSRHFDVVINHNLIMSPS